MQSNMEDNKTELCDPSVSLRRKIWIFLEDPDAHPWVMRVHHVYHFLIVLSVASTIIRTLPTLDDGTTDVFKLIELIFNVIFSVEVVVRFICAPVKCALLKSMFLWMDLAAVTPFFVCLILGLETDANKYIELLTLNVPILRLLKITRHSVGWRLLIISIGQCLQPLTVPAFLLILMTVFASCLLFWLDKHLACQGEDDCAVMTQAFTSIPHAMWFSIVTISTVGYGDVSPRSEEGKVFACALILAGVCYMAMPLAIIGNTFASVWEDRDRIILRDKTTSRMASNGVGISSMILLWEAVDEDGSGQLGMEEFAKVLEQFKVGLTPSAMRQLFKGIDISGDGQISLDEFISFLWPERAGESYKKEEVADQEKEKEKKPEKEKEKSAMKPVEVVDPQDHVAAMALIADVRSRQTDGFEALQRTAERLEALLEPLRVAPQSSAPAGSTRRGTFESYAPAVVRAREHWR